LRRKGIRLKKKPEKSSPAAGDPSAAGIQETDVEMKRYKVMAYILSSGLWDALGSITPEQMLGFRDEALERDLAAWQARYNAQFRRHSYEFDWERFNAEGEALTERIRALLPHNTAVYYEPSDDREFFTPEQCVKDGDSADPQLNEMALREKKRTLLHIGLMAKNPSRPDLSS